MDKKCIPGNNSVRSYFDFLVDIFQLMQILGNVRLMIYKKLTLHKPRVPKLKELIAVPDFMSTKICKKGINLDYIRLLGTKTTFFIIKNQSTIAFTVRLRRENRKYF